ncbi:MAG: CrcB family protein [Planctomycetes bacterium]|jgi:CrcB protein|nr:CrcB family protein [Planctomycetota bacterium]MBT6452272.1 CrcB family protein [Planctomycetota bacterium]MBT6539983.1 CrcB family protein [Planctomycetota bacterium]MBT6785150.1 CrcB family protein [Planctomycetota bacterium]MBT6969288.1 CrcB family protein [Planctomycetota bacterium]
MSWIWAALGGAAGASLRYGIYQWLNRCESSPLEAVAPAAVVPTAAGTLVVNLLGSLLIGLVVGFFDAKSITDERLRIFLVVGVLGGFTTMSALGIEGWQLLREGHTVKSLLLILGQSVGCVLLAATGWTLARTLWGTAGN